MSYSLLLKMSSDNVPVDERRLEYLIDLQHQRYYHLQTLARGILGTVVAIGAILTTLIVSFYDRFPVLVSEPDKYTNVASNLGISPEAALLFSLFNYLQASIYLFLILITVLVLAAQLSEIVLGHPLMPHGGTSQDYVLDRYTSQDPVDLYPILLYNSLNSNQKIIQSAYDRLISSGLRVALLLGLLSGGVVLYINLSEQNLIRVLVYDIMIVTTIFILPFLRKQLGIQNPSQIPQSESSLAQEMFYENNPDSRWSKLSTRRFEEVLIALTSIVSVFAVLAYAISYF